MSGWQTMDTVPRDGTIVDLWHKGGGRMVDVWWIEEDQCWSNLFTDDDFTHWMLPPEPPR